MPVCTLVSGVRSSCEAAAMNSDLRRLISLRCVMSSSSVTTPTSLSSASLIGVDRTRNARPGTVDRPGQHRRGSSEAAGSADRSTSRHRLHDTGVPRHPVYRLAERSSARGPTALGCGIDPGDPTFPSVTITGSSSESIAASVVCCAMSSLPDVRPAQLADAFGHLVETGARVPISSPDRTGTVVSRSPAAIRVVAAVSRRTGPRMVRDEADSRRRSPTPSGQSPGQRDRTTRPAMLDATSAFLRIAS